MCTKGWGTMPNFASCSPYVPGTQDESAFAKNVLIPLLGSVDQPDASKLLRLVYEAYTTVALDSQTWQSRKVEDAPRKLPLQEKTGRELQLASRLPGLRLDDEMELARRHRWHRQL
eukprot:2785991-Amphidinium_carterae.1